MLLSTIRRLKGASPDILLACHSRFAAPHDYGAPDALGEQFSLHATLRNNPSSFITDRTDPARLYLAVEADAAG